MTESEFVNTIAENLGILAAGQTLDSESAAVIRRRMTGVLARIAREELTAVADTASIPDAESLALADIVALECAVAFGISGGKLNELAGAARAGRDSIRMVVSERPHRDTLSMPQWWGPSRGGTYDGTG